MPDSPLTAEDLARLAKITSPTICNAIETFNVRPHNEGFMTPEVKCFFPKMSPMVGYACTLTISAREPGPNPPRIRSADVWEHILSIPAPRILVIHDEDYPNPIGSFWGEVNANIHKALGCIGTITDGGVRDFDEVERLGFHFFAKTELVSHAYVHSVSFGLPVRVGGLVVSPGDLLHGDKHGVAKIPLSIAGKVADAARAIEEKEQRIIQMAQMPDMTPEQFKEKMTQRR